jgi:hypothetical protein
MTQDEFLDFLRDVAILDPATAQVCAEAALLEFLCSEGYTEVVEAYLHLREGSTMIVEHP